MRWKHLLRFPLDIRVAEKQLESHRSMAEVDAGTIGLDLYSDHLLFDCGRHLSCLAASAKNIESNIVVRCSRVLLAAIAHKPHGRRFLAMPHVSWIPSRERFPDGSLVLIDVDGGKADRPLRSQRTVAMLIGRNPEPRTWVMPYPMHPDQIQHLTREKLAELRGQEKAGIFFAGNQKRRYGRSSMNEQFGVLSRLEMLSHLRGEFRERIEPRRAGGDATRIVLRNSATDPIEAGDWMAVLASHQFFLCCPGASQPICHNVVEAMAVGAIPIIEFPERLSPELVDGQNAICFQGTRGLAAAIRRIDTMSQEKITRLSQNAAAYYDEHLDGSKFLKKLRDELNTDFVDQISMPFHDDNFYSPSYPPSGHVPTRQRAA